MCLHITSVLTVRQRYPGFMRETATDHEVTKKMKRAANVIDKFRQEIMPFYVYWYCRMADNFEGVLKVCF